MKRIKFILILLLASSSSYLLARQQADTIIYVSPHYILEGDADTVLMYHPCFTFIENISLVLADSVGEINAGWDRRKVNVADGFDVTLCMLFGQQDTLDNDFLFVIQSTGTDALDTLDQDGCGIGNYQESFAVHIKNRYAYIYEDSDIGDPIIDSIPLRANTLSVQNDTIQRVRFAYDAYTNVFSMDLNRRPIARLPINLKDSIFNGVDTVYWGLVGKVADTSDVLIVALNALSYNYYNPPAGCGDFVVMREFGHQVTNPLNGSFRFAGDSYGVRFDENLHSSVFLSRQKFSNSKISFKIKTSLTGDDDFIGFVFGFEGPMGYPYGPFKTFIFTWRRDKQEDTGCGEYDHEGMSLLQVNTNIPSDLCGNFWVDAVENHENASIIDKSWGSSTGWIPGEVNHFDLYYTAEQVEIYVDDTLKFAFASDSCFEPSRFGFYNYSQAEVDYFDLKYEMLIDFEIVDDTICQQDSAYFEFNNTCDDNFSAENVDSIIWDMGNGVLIPTGVDDFKNELSYQYPASGVYTVRLIIENKNQCRAIKEKTITILESPVIELGVDTVLCYGDSLWLDAHYPGASYLWHDGSTNSNYTSDQPESVFVELTLGACPYADTISIALYPEIINNLHTDTSCFGQNTGFVEVGTTGGVSPYFYSYDDIDCELEICYDLAPGVHVVTTVDSVGCYINTSFVVHEYPEPSYIIGITEPSCYNYADGSIRIFSTAENLVFNFNDDLISSDTVLKNLHSDWYYLTIFDLSNGCIYDDSIFVHQPPPIEVDLAASVNIELGDSIVLQTFSATEPAYDSLHYNWEPDYHLSCTDCANPVAQPYRSQLYILTAHNENDCVRKDSIMVHVDPKRCFYVPNIFSPNRDGENDLFYIYAGNCRKAIDRIKQIRIFNRKGATVFGADNFMPDDPAFGWDGRLNGKDAQTGVYVYFFKVVYIDGSESKLMEGDVVLIR